MKRKHHHLRAHYYLCATVVAVLLLTFTLILPSWRHSTGNFLRLCFTHQPEPLTELYFTDPQKVPVTYQAWLPETFNFTIHNLENKDITYYYRIYTDTNTGFPLQTVKVLNGQYKDIAASIKLDAKDFGQTSEVIVELTDQQQSIHFWVSAGP